MDFAVLQQLGVALSLSTLIGLERERKHQLEHYQDSHGGIRTFALVGLTGALAYMLSSYSVAFFAVITSGFLLLLVAGYVLESRKHGGAGMTSEVASILVYMIGVLSGMGMFLVATVVAVVVLLFLLFKDPLHKLAKHLQYAEMVSTLEFMLIAFVVLPLLPNQAYGPYDFFNPYVIWLLVVFISGISFVSYVAIKILGARKGITVTGFLAGFISTTALAFSFAAESKKTMKIVNPYVLAMVIASTAMFFRIILEVGVLNSNLLNLVMIPMLTMAFVGIFAAVFLWIKNKDSTEKVDDKAVELKSPFSLYPALKFGLFFTLILLLSKFSAAKFGDSGIYLTSFFSGLVDVDAITISMANLAKGEITQSTAVVAISIAAITNTLVKGAIFMLFGSRKVALKIILVMILMSIAGISSLFLI